MKKRMLVTGLMLALFLTGCGKAPVQDLELVKQTLEQAKQGEAQEYAPHPGPAEEVLSGAVVQAHLRADRRRQDRLGQGSSRCADRTGHGPEGSKRSA
jgi:hypothetical protein